MPDDVSKLKIEKERTGAGKKKKSLVIKTAVAGTLVALLVVLYLSGVFTPAVAVEVALVSKFYPSQALTLLNASGYVVAQRKAAVASKVTGRLVALMSEEGKKVRKGEVLARLENEDALAGREQAEANLGSALQALEQAKAELQDATLFVNRNRELMEKGFVSAQDYDTANARYRKAVASVAGAGAAIAASRAALKGAEVAVEYALIRSPFDAVVLTKNADIGDIVTPLGAAANARASVFTLADMESLQVEVDVSESNLGQVKNGQPCEILLDAFPDVRFRGKVYMIVPTADRSKATIMVKVAFLGRDSRILPEMSARVAFLERPLSVEEERPRTAMNPSAVVEVRDKKIVYLVSGDKVVETPVTLGGTAGDMVEVLSGVRAGDKVVLKPSERLRNGSRIKVLEK